MSTTTYCPSCGTPAADHDRFCADCGVRLADEGPTAEHRVDEPAEAVTASPFAGATPPIGEAVPLETLNGSGLGSGQDGPSPNAAAPAAAAGAPPVPPAVPYVVQASPSAGGPPVGLVAALVGAGLLALAGVTAAIVLALSGNDDAAPAPLTTSPIATTPTSTVTVIERTTTVRRSSSASSRRSTSSRSTAPAASIAASTPSRSSDRAEIRSVVQRHWSLVEQGQYVAAYALLAPGTQDRAAWLQDKETDRPSTASISLGQPTLTSSTTATVPVLNLHTVANSGCNNWSGFYRMSKIGGEWKIAKAKISPTPC